MQSSNKNLGYSSMIKASCLELGRNFDKNRPETKKKNILIPRQFFIPYIQYGRIEYGMKLQSGFAEGSAPVTSSLKFSSIVTLEALRCTASRFALFTLRCMSCYLITVTVYTTMFSELVGPRVILAQVYFTKM